GPGFRASRSQRARPPSGCVRAEGAFTQASCAGRDRLGDRDSARRYSAIVDPEPRQARHQMVETEASGGVLMTDPPADPLESPALASAWLDAHCGARCARADVILHAPSSAFRGPGGGENQLIQTGR